ncbi:Polyketide-type polyunsaturated fatty acid synthase PfaA OS=Streptomyces glaucescens OX=1907 GN=SGLAU_07210 PE=4 SV=1 [Streptomyces glaucescens]
MERTALGAHASRCTPTRPAPPTATDAAANRRTLVDQLLHPVDFVAGIERCAGGLRVYVEFGPKRVLTDLVDRILEGRTDVVTLAVDGGPAKDGELALRAALELAVLGLPLTGLDDHVAPSRTSPSARA